jgi:hypothetical protein
MPDIMKGTLPPNHTQASAQASPSETKPFQSYHSPFLPPDSPLLSASSSAARSHFVPLNDLTTDSEIGEKVQRGASHPPSSTALASRPKTPCNSKPATSSDTMRSTDSGPHSYSTRLNDVSTDSEGRKVQRSASRPPSSVTLAVRQKTPYKLGEKAALVNSSSISSGATETAASASWYSVPLNDMATDSDTGHKVQLASSRAPSSATLVSRKRTPYKADKFSAATCVPPSSGTHSQESESEVDEFNSSPRPPRSSTIGTPFAPTLLLQPSTTSDPATTHVGRHSHSTQIQPTQQEGTDSDEGGSEDNVPEAVPSFDNMFVGDHPGSDGADCEEKEKFEEDPSGDEDQDVDATATSSPEQRSNSMNSSPCGRVSDVAGTSEIDLGADAGSRHHVTFGNWDHSDSSRNMRSFQRGPATLKHELDTHPMTASVPPTVHEICSLPPSSPPSVGATFDLDDNDEGQDSSEPPAPEVATWSDDDVPIDPYGFFSIRQLARG